MSEPSTPGWALAWRVLSALETGALAGAAAAALAGLARRGPALPPPKSVVISNTSCELGRELVSLLRAHGCRVTCGANATSEANNEVTSEAIRDTNVARSGINSNNITVSKGANQVTSLANSEITYLNNNSKVNQVDALIVVGAEPAADGIDGLCGLVSEDVYANLKSLEALSVYLRPGGRVVWAASGAGGGAFSGAVQAFDQVLRTQVERVAAASQCTPVWVGRSKGVKQTAARVVNALFPEKNIPLSSRFSIRNITEIVSGYFDRWLKITS
ncbi:uncharacterized protein LOC105390217 [Plutella xylostella]|uniref:uncharacterized protein LOC105390217 n=1 Tax=Plutella xylostella TaxID=51655 RepID=UPI002032C6C2|nr:uncharacterized protein LOC105390217 [Plutella xylostella]